MHQLQEIIDRIRATINSDCYEDTPEVRGLVREYGEACRELNERLRRCGEYLRLGLRAEAIQAAETEPRLLDAVGVLDGLSEFERQAWSDFCEFLEVSAPEPLLIDVATLVDEAYGDHDRIGTLLRRHRRLAVQRAPLSMRLEVLREIALQDANSEFWEEDVREYEAARIAEIPGELNELNRSPSVDRLEALVAELKSREWRTTPPRKYLAAARKLQQASVVKAARQQLEQAELELQAAFAAMDFEQARGAFDTWQENVGNAKLSEQDPLYLRALPAVAWCEQMVARESENAAYEQLVAEIEAALREDTTPVEELQRLSDQAHLFDRPLPTGVGSRLNHRIDALMRQQRRRRLLLAGGAVVATALLAATIGFIVARANDAAHRREIIARITGAVEQGDTEQATALVEQFDGRWGNLPEWIDTRQAVTEMRDQLEDRTARISGLLQELAAVPDTDGDTFVKLSGQAIEVTREEPVLDDLVALVERRTRELTSERQLRLKEREDDVRRRLAVQSEALTNLQAAYRSMKSDEFTTQSRRIEDALGVIAAGTSGLDESLADEVKLYQSQLVDLRNVYDTHVRLIALREQLDTSSRTDLQGGPATIGEYVSALKEYQEVASESPAAVGLTKSVKESEHWESVAAFTQTVASWAEEPVTDDLPFLKRRQHLCEEYVKKCPAGPLADRMEACARTMETLARRYEPADGLVKELRRRIVDHASMNLHTLQDTKYDWPYYIADLDSIGGANNPTFTPWRKRAGEISKQQQILSNRLAYSKPRPAPQNRLAEVFDKTLSGLTIDNWEETFRGMTQRVIDTDNVDPILRVVILKQLQELGAAGSVVLASHKPFATYAERLDTAYLNVNPKTDWTDPADERVNSAREIAETYLDTLKTADLHAIWNTAEAGSPETLNPVTTGFQAVGWMALDKQNEPTVDITPPEEGDWRLFVVVVPPDEMDAKAQLVEIGRAADSKLLLQGAATGAHHQTGRLVFASQAD
ncbi:hypothetical protein Mal4_35480 [Maioricimonas rarisocia]|uniref:Uncharacterized protein n=1 Tax=Maioricimonas rarisocia TaxID=2528026 RepID=A0A517Z9T9_9PLAN|nr:hypothetical protein [Maioricimonas rarisocia]QDU39211.1 hypothetical protein Mal4_35480 [Maioricimonas rarisocia]